MVTERDEKGRELFNWAQSLKAATPKPCLSLQSRYQGAATERDHVTLPLPVKGEFMSLSTQSVQQQEVFDLVRLAVEGAANDRGLLAATVTIRRILDAHPDCQISPGELLIEIARLARQKRVGLEFGTPLPAPGRLPLRATRD